MDGEVEKIERTSFVTALTISVGDRVCCKVRTTYVMTDVDWNPTPVPAEVRALLLQS